MKSKDLFLESFKKKVANMTSLEFSRAYSSLNDLSVSRMMLHEGLIKTYDLEKTVAYVKDYVGLEDWNIVYERARNGIITVRIVIPEGDEETYRNVCRVMCDLCGYYVTHERFAPVKDKDGNLIDCREMFFRPKFSSRKRVEEYLKRHPRVWHITSMERAEKIKKQGFVPKSSNKLFKYPEKVHFLLGFYTEDQVADIGKKLKRVEGRDNEVWTIMVVDIRKPDGTFPKFYVDPDLDGSIYTYENIPSSSIIETFEEKRRRNLEETIDYIRDSIGKL